jgi:hypothetical protein
LYSTYIIVHFGYTKHREISAVDAWILDVIGHGGRTAKSESWVKKMTKKLEEENRD